MESFDCLHKSAVSPEVLCQHKYLNVDAQELPGILSKYQPIAGQAMSTSSSKTVGWEVQKESPVLNLTSEPLSLP